MYFADTQLPRRPGCLPGCGTLVLCAVILWPSLAWLIVNSIWWVKAIGIMILVLCVVLACVSILFSLAERSAGSRVTISIKC